MEETKYLELLNKYNENHKVLLELQNKKTKNEVLLATYEAEQEDLEEQLKRIKQEIVPSGYYNYDLKTQKLLELKKEINKKIKLCKEHPWYREISNYTLFNNKLSDSKLLNSLKLIIPVISLDVLIGLLTSSLGIPAVILSECIALFFEVALLNTYFFAYADFSWPCATTPTKLTKKLEKYRKKTDKKIKKRQKRLAKKHGIIPIENQSENEIHDNPIINTIAELNTSLQNKIGQIAKLKEEIKTLAEKEYDAKLDDEILEIELYGVLLNDNSVEQTPKLDEPKEEKTLNKKTRNL